MKRNPIILSPHAVALIQIYTRHDDFTDIWASDLDPMMRQVDFKDSAREFIDQLNEHWCVAFMEALAQEIRGRIGGSDD